MGCFPGANKVNSTMRDSEDGRNLKFMETWFRKAVRLDGTVGLALRQQWVSEKGRLYWQKERLPEVCVGEWEMGVVARGELSPIQGRIGVYGVSCFFCPVCNGRLIINLGESLMAILPEFELPSDPNKTVRLRGSHSFRRH